MQAVDRSKVFRKIDLGKKLLKTKESNIKNRMKAVTYHHQEIID